LQRTNKVEALTNLDDTRNEYIKSLRSGEMEEPDFEMLENKLLEYIEKIHSLHKQ
jgi:hypothetical protein